MVSASFISCGAEEEATGDKNVLQELVLATIYEKFTAHTNSA